MAERPRTNFKDFDLLQDDISDEGILRNTPAETPLLCTISCEHTRTQAVQWRSLEDQITNMYFVNRST